jgi:hypothetical protein
MQGGGQAEEVKVPAKFKSVTKVEIAPKAVKAPAAKKK